MAEASDWQRDPGGLRRGAREATLRGARQLPRPGAQRQRRPRPAGGRSLAPRRPRACRRVPLAAGGGPLHARPRRAAGWALPGGGARSGAAGWAWRTGRRATTTSSARPWRSRSSWAARGQRGCAAWSASAGSWPASSTPTSRPSSTAATEEGQPYLVMEHVEGGAHRRVLRRTRARPSARGWRCSGRLRGRAIRPPEPGRPPGPQAGEHPGDGRRPAEAPRLRHREAAAPGSPDRGHRDVGSRLDAGLREPGAGAGRCPDHRERRVLAGRHALRAPHRPAAPAARGTRWRRWVRTVCEDGARPRRAPGVRARTRRAAPAGTVRASRRPRHHRR